VGLLAPVAKVAKMPTAEKRYVILGTKPLPDNEDVFIREFSLKSVDPEVGRANRGYQVALPGVLCDVVPTERPADVPKHILPRETKPHTLTEEEAKLLEATQYFVEVKCTPEPDLPPRALPEHAEVTAETIAKIMDGWIHDIHTGRYWPRDAWSALRSAKRRYDSRRLFRVFTLKGDDGFYLIGTRGLASFGRPDLFLYPVAGDQVDAVMEPFMALVDTTLDETKLGSGYDIQLGELTVRLIPKGVYLNTINGTAPSLPQRGAGQSHRDFIVADPSLEQGNASEYGGFIRRFIVR